MGLGQAHVETFIGGGLKTLVIGKKIIEDCSQLIEDFCLWALLLTGISPGALVLGLVHQC